MASDLDGRAFVIFGGSGGIGAALARRLARRGARLMLAAREQDRLDALARELGAETHAGDARLSATCDGAVARAVEAFGRLDGMACCVGSVFVKPLQRVTDDEWRTTLAQNLDVAFFCLRAAVRAMETSGGAVVLCSTAAAATGMVNHEAIAAAKAGVEGLARAAAATGASHSVRVNVVAPGLVKTPLTEKLWSTEVAARASMAMHPLGRLGEPDDVASAMEWLLDPANGWVTGQTLGVDGGLAHVRPRGKG